MGGNQGERRAKLESVRSSLEKRGVTGSSRDLSIYSGGGRPRGRESTHSERRESDRLEEYQEDNHVLEIDFEIIGNRGSERQIPNKTRDSERKAISRLEGENQPDIVQRIKFREYSQSLRHHAAKGRPANMQRGK